MHARFYRERLGRQPSDVLRGLVLEMQRMASQVIDMQAQSEVLAQVTQMEDLALAVRELETEVEEADSGESVRERLLALQEPPVDTTLTTRQLLDRFLDQEEEEERVQAGEIQRLETREARLEQIIKNSEEALKGALALLVLPE